MQKSRTGVTLVELLVVVAVISLLIAILLPTLGGAREQSRRTVCLSNMRQIGHGWHVYADENSDISVPGRYAAEPGGMSNPANFYDVGNGMKFRARWIETLGKHVGIYAFNMPDPMDDRQDYDSRVYQCPTAPERVDARNYAYGYNHHFLGNARRGAGGRFINWPVVRTRITNFASTVLAAENMGTAAGVAKNDRLPYSNNGMDMREIGNHAWSLDPPRLTDVSDRGDGNPGSFRTAVDDRHAGRTNVVFCDGHGETQRPEALGYRRLGDGRFVDLETVNDPPDNRLFSGTGRDDDPPAVPN